MSERAKVKSPLELKIEREVRKEIVDHLLKGNPFFIEEIEHRLVPLSVLEELEWSGHRIEEEWKVYSCCPSCRGLESSGHLPDCRLAKALGR